VFVRSCLHFVRSSRRCAPGARCSQWDRPADTESWLPMGPVIVPLSGPWTVDNIRPDLADERGRFHVAGDARWVAARRRDVAISPATMRRVGTVPSREESALSHPRPCKPLDPRAEACAGEVPVRSGQGRLLQGAHLVSVPVTVTGVAVSAPLNPRSWDFAPLRIVRVVARKLLDLFLVPYLVIDGGPAGPPP